MVLARSSAASPLLLLALLACTIAAAGGDLICDTANCGKGSCAETLLFPNYKCDCDPGWSRAINFLDFSPCIIPNCSFDSACFNLRPVPPRGIPITDICVAVNCGPGGECKKGDGFFSFHCECQPGYVNLLNLTALPCVKNCVFGMDCSTLGITPPPSPPPASTPSPAPPGYVSSQSLLQLLLLVSMAMVQVV